MAALLVCDMQNGILPMMDKETLPALLENTKKAIEHARSKNLLIIYIRVAFHKGYFEISPNNKVCDSKMDFFFF